MRPGIQEWIHKLEVGDGVRYVKVAALILGFLTLAVIFDMRGYKAFGTQEAMDVGQLARNISEGKGFTTDFIRPVSVHLLQKRQGEGVPVLREPHPDLANPPVYPLILSGFMRVTNLNYDISRGSTFWWYQPEVAIAILNQFLFFVVIFMVFRLARRLFDEPVAWVSALIVGGTNLFWQFTVSGLSTILLLIIFLGVVWCLIELEEAQREGKRSNSWFLIIAIVTGVLVGVGGLTRYSFAWLILPVVGFLALFMDSRRVAVCAVAFTAFVVVMTPWISRNYQLCGHLFGTASFALHQDTNPFRGNRLERFLTSEFEVELERVNSDIVFRKLMLNTRTIIEKDLPTLGGNWTTAFFLAGLLLPFKNAGLNRLRFFALSCVGLFVIVQALGKTHLSDDSPDVNSENLLVLLAPLIFVFGVGMYYTLLDQIELPIPQWRTVITSLFCLIVCAPLIFSLLPPRRHPFAYPPYWPPGIQDISHMLEEGELMMSDMPWAVAWYGGRECIWATLSAPQSPKVTGESDFFAINDFHRPIYGLYLTTLTTDARFYSQMLKSKDYDWGRFMIESMLRATVPTGFPLKQAPDNMLGTGQLFLSDRVRWEGSSQ